MILIETKYKIYNNESLAIIKVFKTWYYHLKDYKHKIFVFIDHNNLRYFINIKKLSSNQVY